METLLIIFLATYVIAMLSIMASIFVMFKDDYHSGYNDGEFFYTIKQQFKEYNKPMTPYQFGWNKAIRKNSV